MARIALLPLVLLALLGAIQPAAAETDEPDESGYVESAFEECEEDPAACEEEDQAAETEAAEGSAAPECGLRSASARAFVKKDKLKLTIGYTTYEPAKATIEISNGSTRIGPFKRRLGRSGVLRFTKTFGEQRIGKRTVIRIELPSEGPDCATRLTAANRAARR